MQHTEDIRTQSRHCQRLGSQTPLMLSAVMVPKLGARAGGEGVAMGARARARMLRFLRSKFTCAHKQHIFGGHRWRKASAAQLRQSTQMVHQPYVVASA
eukprot:1103627-Pleurochrysis_carterae.AAC.4